MRAAIVAPRVKRPALPADARSALSDVVHRCAAGIDDRQFALASEFFTADGELWTPRPPDELQPVECHRGTAAVAAAISAVATMARTEHAIVGEVYDAAPEQDAATGRIACIAHHWERRDDTLVDLVWHLRYDDEYRLSAAGWRISRRALTINAIETRPVRRLLPADDG